MPSTTEPRHLVISTALLVLTGGLVAVLMLASSQTSSAASSATPGHSPTPTMSNDMPGMDHGDLPGSTPSPSPSAGAPAKTHDHSSGNGHDSSPTPTLSADGHGTAHEHGNTPSPTASADGHTEHGGAQGTAEPAPDRPLAPVLGAFGGASSVVMLSAAFLRRKDQAGSTARQAARGDNRTQK